MKKIIPLFALLFLACSIQAQVVSIEPFADGFSSPIDLQNAGDERLFVVEKSGVIKILNLDGTVNPTPFLDIQSLINDAGERGLLGLAFHPDYATNGFFYVHYSDTNGDTQISRFSVDSGNPDIADSTSELSILFVDQPASNHNGGSIAFGTDGMLYIALGDGGGGGDQDNNAQNLLLLLGKLLRIDVDNPTGGNNYGIPANNPFVGNPDGRDEIWAYGLRNPYRFSIDDEAGDIWIGDVGQGSVEEVNKAPLSEAGINYGWRCFEGSEPFNTGGCPDPSELTFPVAEYPWSAGGSVVGGYVYRGSIYQDLQEVYIFADIDGMISTVDSDLNYIDQGSYPEFFWVGFGEDINEELYLLDITGSIVKIQGSVLSVPEFDKNSISISPNPASDYVTISSSERILTSIQVVDIRGSIIMSENFSAPQRTIETTSLSQGIYMIQVLADDGSKVTKKLVVQ
ncbi:PQQ-dependent sugar dehydrogenase [Jejudonia soesokkakensis]|uniref:PQQ-dependent sugar dehydrogenase n=1 Tax=Jejudonia soesokkakensis TaxID=1323432 RepID=A0ABW2MXJ4_9FLAO